ncbi:hypothetical protein B7R21_15430 [Subtercola boreus]|uniref:HEPN domain-containing protein n=2 Tax=Subtercola boreus TaxID=120213 RepID=A0A3E0VCG0_9MICO|nr:hypothetical protein B7R21_15430 [Subtercola boreus]
MDPTSITQRAGTAREHLQVAEERLEYSALTAIPSAEAQVAASNAISAGIAASDAICGKALGERSNESDHRVAVALLASVHPGGAELSSRLARLLADKSQHQYGGYVTRKRAEKAVKHAKILVDAMQVFGIA